MRRERVAGRLRERRRAATGFELTRKELRDEGFGRRVGRIVDDQAVGAEDRFDPLREGFGHAGARSIRTAQRGHQPVGELGLAEHRGELVQAVLDAFIQDQRRDRSFFGSFGLRKGDRVRLEARIEHRTACDFLPVVILGVDPENRDDVCLLLPAGLARELNRGDGLEQREQGAAERAGLLARHDGNGPGRL